jgi:hypothetical protein
LVALAIAPPAHAASSRAEYVAQVEPICEGAQKPTFKAYLGSFKGVPPIDDREHPTQRESHQVDRALGRLYSRVAGIYGRTSSRIGAVSPAPGDEAAVAAWLAGRAQAQALWLRAGRAARHLKARRADGLTQKGIKVSDSASRNVSEFGFHFCTFSIGDAEL